MLRAALLILLSLAGADACAGAPLRVAWGAHNAPPYAVVENGELRSGLIHDVGIEIGRHLGSDVVFVNVPRARNETQLRDGQVDVTCILAPQWLEQPDAFDWSEPLFDEENVVVQPAGGKPWKGLDDLANRQLATIQAYNYPTLQPLFETHRVERSDGANLDSNMQRLALGRVDAVIDANVPVYYWLAHHDGRGRFQVAAFAVSKQNVSCAISRRAPGGSARIRDAINRMVHDGTLRTVLAPYLPPH